MSSRKALLTVTSRHLIRTRGEKMNKFKTYYILNDGSVTVHKTHCGLAPTEGANIMKH